ncbi:hypothetical protein BJ165DRAFT_1524247 [Panaeolus papilionaceus]|nr:hypothetical protein BJ165DRAFT_1524247 [Panaeolus papilionaceus]
MALCLLQGLPPFLLFTHHAGFTHHIFVVHSPREVYGASFVWFTHHVGFTPHQVAHLLPYGLNTVSGYTHYLWSTPTQLQSLIRRQVYVSIFVVSIPLPVDTPNYVAPLTRHRRRAMFDIGWAVSLSGVHPPPTFGPEPAKLGSGRRTTSVGKIKTDGTDHEIGRQQTSYSKSSFLCPPSQRNSSKKMTDARIYPDVLDLFFVTWISAHDDIRWFFFRESTGVAESTTKPPKSKKSKSNVDNDDEHDSENDNVDLSGDDNDDWGKFLEEEKTSEGSKGPAMRLHRMSAHQSPYSLNSHKAVFIQMWLMLVPRLSIGSDEETQ